MSSKTQLPCRDLSKTRTFFADQIGFACDDSRPDVLTVRVEGSQIEFWALGQSDFKECQGQISVANLNALKRHFHARGIPVQLNERKSRLSELRLFDPDGNCILFVEA